MNRYYVKLTSEARVEGPYSFDEIREKVKAGGLHRTSVAVIAAGQNAFQLGSSAGWHSLAALFGSDLDKPGTIVETPIEVTTASIPASGPEELTSATRESANSSRAAKAVMARYQDAYGVARAIAGIGTLIKTVGMLLGGLIAFVFMLGSSQVPDYQKFGAFILGLVLAALVGGTFYLFGIVISALGQLLQAGLDTAVNTSPFLSHDQRANTMSLV